MNTDEVARRLLITTRIIHWVFLASVPVAIIIMVLLRKLGFVGLYGSDAPLLHAAEITAGGISLLLLVVALSWPRLARWHKANDRSRMDVLYWHIIRISFLETIVIYGLTLGIMGSRWVVLAPLFLLAAAALVLTFPTDSRLARWQGKQVR